LPRHGFILDTIFITAFITAERRRFMSDQAESVGAEKVPCEVCRKEVPLSEAKVSEAADYVAHFCGLECYAEWKRRSEQTGKPE